MRLGVPRIRPAEPCTKPPPPRRLGRLAKLAERRRVARSHEQALEMELQPRARRRLRRHIGNGRHRRGHSRRRRRRRRRVHVEFQFEKRDHELRVAAPGAHGRGAHRADRRIRLWPLAARSLLVNYPPWRINGNCPVLRCPVLRCSLPRCLPLRCVQGAVEGEQATSQLGSR